MIILLGCNQTTPLFLQLNRARNARWDDIWGSDAKHQESKRYFKYEYTTGLTNVFDNRITLNGTRGIFIGQVYGSITTIYTGDNQHTVLLTSRGRVYALWKNWKESMKSKAEEKLKQYWGDDIIAIASGDNHIVGLRLDGTVVAEGNNDYGQRNVFEWKDIIAITAAGNHTIGLREDGTVVSTGNNDYSQCDVSEWEDVGLQ